VQPLHLTDVVAHNNSRFLRQTGKLRLYLADAATVVAEIAGEFRQICLLGFMTDGSIFVYWPYLHVQDGVLDVIEFPPPNRDGSVTLRLGERRQFASQKVKYSHHASGEAHFNLSGRVPTVVKRPAFPLAGPIGRVFELSAFFPQSFKRLGNLKGKRLYLPFQIPDASVSALRVRAEWRRKGDIIRSVQGRGTVGPLAPYARRSTGERGRMFFFGPPLKCPIRDHVLCVIGEVVALPTGVGEPGVVFMGGYDLHEATPPEDPEKVKIRGALVAIYPYHAKGHDQSWVNTLVSPLRDFRAPWRRLIVYLRYVAARLRGWQTRV